MDHPNNVVEFTLFALENKKAKDFLAPEGSIVFQNLGFPRDIEDCTCIPTGPVAIWGRTGVTELDAQWYQPIEEIARDEIPPIPASFPKIKGHMCHKLRPDKSYYVLTSLSVDGTEVHVAVFVGKELHFRRLGHIVRLDLSSVPESQPFTLSVEWSYHHIEARVTWLEGEGLDRYFSGRGVPYKELPHYSPPRVGKVFQFKARTTFETTLLPAQVAKAIWHHSKDEITDKDEFGHPRQDAGTPRRAYSNGADFLNTLLNVFTEIQGILKKTKPDAFWDGSKPKKETSSGASLRLLLEAICAYKNIRVFQEDPSRSGNVDFVFSGISNDLEHLEMILEIKNAHSDRLDRGLTHQLPQYMEERQAEYGVYGVLWYKGRNFDMPSDATAKECVLRLQRVKPKEVYDVIPFDVSFPIQASKL